MPRSIQQAAEAIAAEEREDPDSPIVQDAETRAVVQAAARVVKRLASEYLPSPFGSIVAMGIDMIVQSVSNADLSIGHY